MIEVGPLQSSEINLNISEDTPRNQAISMLYQDYREGKSIEGLLPEDAAGYMAQTFARYLLDHLAELEALTREMASGMEKLERLRKEKFPDKPGI